MQGSDGVDNAMRRFVEHQRRRQRQQACENGVALGRPGGQEAGKVELFFQQAAGRQRRDRGRCARQWNDAQASRADRIDDARARVGDSRCAGIRYQRDPLAGLQPLDQFFRHFAFVVLMCGDEGFVQAVARQEMAGIAGVFTRHCIDQRQYIERAQCDVTCVTDRRGHDVQGARRTNLA